MEEMGHASPQDKVKQLYRLGAEIFVCHPSMDVFGVTEEDLIVPKAHLAEYVSFLEEMRDANIQLFA